MAIPNSYYRVVINNATGTAPKNGFVDNTKIEQYMSTLAPTNLAASEAKERANMRWENIVRKLSYMTNPLHLMNFVATAATTNAEASSFAFTVVYDRPNYLSTVSENDGSTLNRETAIKRWIARALIENVTQQREIYDPTVVADKWNNSVPRGLIVRPAFVAESPIASGTTPAMLTAAELLITVTPIANTF